jgi:hypothetical protein
LTLARSALINECEREEENALFTSTTFFIWLRCLRVIRALLWGGGAVGSISAASHILQGTPEAKALMAAAALAGVLLPGLGRALGLDAMIKDYADLAGKFKNLQGEFRRARLIWSHKPLAEFEVETRRLIKTMNDARKPSLTPPDWCFKLARRKIRDGHYSHAVDEALAGRPKHA